MDADLTALPVTRLAKLEPRPRGKGWLIEDLWAAGGVGCIGLGAPADVEGRKDLAGHGDGHRRR